MHPAQPDAAPLRGDRPYSNPFPWHSSQRAPPIRCMVNARCSGPIVTVGIVAVVPLVPLVPLVVAGVVVLLVVLEVVVLPDALYSLRARESAE